ncbi:MAG: hypothetical protein B7Y59_00430 [Burkholderiales bacterium 35-55-47]|nr:MAG: hypothetical protein B7Y59_00430 [Burkholderiales bacterium 35-55-47]
MCVWLLVINCSNRGLRLFAIVCNSKFMKNLHALVQTLACEIILLHPYDTRESPDYISIFKKNQRVRKYLEIGHLI